MTGWFMLIVGVIGALLAVGLVAFDRQQAAYSAGGRPGEVWCSPQGVTYLVNDYRWSPVVMVDRKGKPVHCEVQ